MGDQIVVGLTGPFGAGCTTVADDLVQRLGWRKYSLSEAMRELAPNFVHRLDKQKLTSAKFRSYQQDVGDKIRENDIHAIPAKVVNEIQQDENLDKSKASLDIVIDGIRNPGEITYLRDHFPRFFVMAIFASFQNRFTRRQDDYDGNLWDFERDDQRDSGEFEQPFGQKVQLCVDRSDMLISNDRQFGEPFIKDELRHNIDSYIKLMKEPGSRSPHSWELNMAQAYGASLMSTCSKRKVGAVLVKEEKREKEEKRVEESTLRHRARSYIIAGGYNEAPPGVRPCEQRGGPEYCYKDEKIKEVLKKEYQHCPKCGKKLGLPSDFKVPFKCPSRRCDARLGRDFIPGRMLELCIAVHAEEAAFLQGSRFGGIEVDGSILYTTTFPCPLCAKMLVHAGIQRVVFAEPYPQDEAIDALEEGHVPAQLFEGIKGRAYHRLFETPAHKV